MTERTITWIIGLFCSILISIFGLWVNGLSNKFKQEKEDREKENKEIKEEMKYFRAEIKDINEKIAHAENFFLNKSWEMKEEINNKIIEVLNKK